MRAVSVSEPLTDLVHIKPKPAAAYAQVWTTPCHEIVDRADRHLQHGGNIAFAAVAGHRRQHVIDWVGISRRYAFIYVHHELNVILLEA